MSRVQLKDGSIVEIDIDPSWDNDAVQRAIREYKANPDPSETDSWPTYLGKEALSIGRSGAAGLASTVDTLGNLMPAVGLPTKIASRLWNGQPLTDPNSAVKVGGVGLDLNMLNPFSGEQPTRDLYEDVVPKGPRGSDYETTGKVAEVVVPAVAETLLTGSPKSALWRAPRDLALGIGGGYVGEEVDKKLGGTGELGRIFGSAVTPAVAASRLGAKIATIKTGLPLVTKVLNKVGLGRLDPYKLIPKSTPADAAGRALVGTTASGAFDYEENR